MSRFKRVAIKGAKGGLLAIPLAAAALLLCACGDRAAEEPGAASPTGETLRLAEEFCSALIAGDAVAFADYLPAALEQAAPAELAAELPFIFPVDRCSVVEAVSDPGLLFLVADLESGPAEVRGVFGLRLGAGHKTLIYVGAELESALGHVAGVRRRPNVSACAHAAAEVRGALAALKRITGEYGTLTALMEYDLINLAAVNRVCAMLSIDISMGPDDYEIAAVPKGYKPDECLLTAGPDSDQVRISGPECE